MAEQLNGKPQLRNTWKRIALDNIALHVLYFYINSFTCANADFSQINQREHSFKVNILLIAFWGAYQFWNILEGTWGEGDGCSWPRHIFPACFCKWNSRSRSTFRTLKFPLKIDNPFLSFFVVASAKWEIFKIMFEMLLPTARLTQLLSHSSALREPF